MKTWIVLVVLAVGMVSCGDDAPKKGNTTNNNANSSNSANSENSSTTNPDPTNSENSTNNVLNNSFNSTNNFNSSNNFNSLNNTTNNTNNTTNSANNTNNVEPNNTVGTASCAEIVQCVSEMCEASDENCQRTCFLEGSENGRQDYTLLVQCGSTNCDDVASQDEFLMCVQEFCTNELQACFGA